jgi:hypothetical protein
MRAVTRTYLCVATLFSASTTAFADPCADLSAGIYLPSKSLAELVSQAQKAGVKKDEFETTAQYQARLAASGSALAGTTFVIEWPLESGFTFDADVGRASYSKYSLDGMCLTNDFDMPVDVKSLRFGAPGGYGQSSYCFAKTIERAAGKPYTAHNGFGAEVQVEPIHTKAIGIFLGQGKMLQDIFTGRESYSSQEPLFSANVTGEDARSLKENGVALMVVTPKPPYFFQGSYYVEPKIDRPTELFNKTDYVIADVRCMALADRKLKKVYQTRFLLGQR